MYAFSFERPSSTAEAARLAAGPGAKLLAGGQTLPLEAEDLRVFDALRVMQVERDGRLEAWLVDRRPASRTTLFQTALALAGA